MKAKNRKCSDCNKTFGTKKLYDRHLQTHRGEKPFECITCNKCFSREEFLKNHIRTHTGEKPYQCRFCDARFSNSGKLRCHTFTHTGSPYKCSACPSTFSSSSQLKIHLRIHTGERPFKCSECAMKFASKGKLVSHKRVHSAGKFFSCHLCPKQYRQKQGLKWHLRIHGGETFKCGSCDFETFYKEVLSQHLKRKHYTESLSLFQCTLCAKTLKEKASLEHHIRVHTGEKPYKCKFCGNSFRSFQQMRTCIQKHSHVATSEIKKKPHKCKICSKCFARQGHLKSHMCVHTDEKAFHCAQCPKKFKRNENLERHLVSHNGGNFKCTFCPKEFHKQSSLAEHLRLHTGEKPFKCKLCPFRSRVAIKKVHRMNHEKEGKFKCRFCTYSSSRNGIKLQHEQNDHGSDIVSMVETPEPVRNSTISQSSEAHPLTCNECKFSTFNEKHLSIHYSQCHSLPLVPLMKLMLENTN